MNLPSSSMKVPKPMPPSNAAVALIRPPRNPSSRRMASSMSKPPQSRCAMCRPPPPTWGKHIHARKKRMSSSEATLATKNSSNCPPLVVLRARRPSLVLRASICCIWYLLVRLIEDLSVCPSGAFFRISFEERRLHPLLCFQRHSHITIDTVLQSLRKTLRTTQTSITLEDGFICLHPPVGVFQPAGS